MSSQVLSLLALLVQKYKYFQRGGRREPFFKKKLTRLSTVLVAAGTQFTCFTSTKVQRLTRLSTGLVVGGAGGDARVHVC